MGIFENNPTITVRQARDIVTGEANPGDPAKRPPEEVATPTSVQGIVDSILEVGRQRKVLFDRLRSALESGNDADALHFARQLCGLPDKNRK